MSIHVHICNNCFFLAITHFYTTILNILMHVLYMFINCLYTQMHINIHTHTLIYIHNIHICYKNYSHRKRTVENKQTYKYLFLVHQLLWAGGADEGSVAVASRSQYTHFHRGGLLRTGKVGHSIADELCRFGGSCVQIFTLGQFYLFIHLFIHTCIHTFIHVSK